MFSLTDAKFFFYAFIEVVFQMFDGFINVLVDLGSFIMSCGDDILNELPVVLDVDAGDVSELPADLVNADNVLMVTCRG